MQALLCPAVSRQALNGSLSYTASSKSSLPHFSPLPWFPHSHWLAVSYITFIPLFKRHPWVGVPPGLPACLSVSSVAVIPSRKLLQASTLTGSFSRPLSFSRPRGAHSLSNSSWFSVLTSWRGHCKEAFLHEWTNTHHSLASDPISLCLQRWTIIDSAQNRLLEPQEHTTYTLSLNLAEYPAAMQPGKSILVFNCYSDTIFSVKLDQPWATTHHNSIP